MTILILYSVPFWLAGIDPRRVWEELQPDILRYQWKRVDDLSTWVSTPKAIAAPADLVPYEPVTGRDIEHEQLALTFVSITTIWTLAGKAEEFKAHKGTPRDD